MVEIMYCQYCNKECKNNNSLHQHEIRCKLNPNKIDTSNSWNNKNRQVWNKGLTKETDDRVLKGAKILGKTISKKHKGKALSNEHKKAISKGMINFLESNPDKVPYLLNHSSKVSYPEKYFIDLFEKEDINLDYHIHISRYQLDFCNLENKIDIEIDGEQHYTDKKIIEHDKIRNKYLSDLGFTIYRIRWSTYKKLNYLDKQKIINEIKCLFKS